MDELLKGLIDPIDIVKESVEDDMMNQSIDEPITEDVNIPVPGGLGEKPKAHEVPGTKISIPSGKEISEDVYNQALTNLKKTFKEGVEMLEILEGCKVIQKTEDEIQNEMLESAIGTALLEACENGPIFEAVDRSDKEEVKKIIKNIRSKVSKDFKGKDSNFRDVNMVSRIIAATVAGATAGGGLGESWKTRLWQVIGVFHCEDSNVKDMVDGLNEKYKEDLGEYKFLYCLTKGGLYDAFKLKFGWKNVKKIYFLLVDKKLPKDIKDMQDEINKEIDEKNKGDKVKDKK